MYLFNNVGRTFDPMINKNSMPYLIKAATTYVGLKFPKHIIRNIAQEFSSTGAFRYHRLIEDPICIALDTWVVDRYS